MASAVDLDALAEMHSRDECPLDRWGRYLIVPAAGGDPAPHTRATTVAKTLDDGFGLEKWSRRMTLDGFAARPDLWARYCATAADDKVAKDRLADQAKEAAAASAGANWGTALHAVTEWVDQGRPVESVPPQFQADVKAYRDTLERLGIGILPEYMERYVVVPGLAVAGKLDRIVAFGTRRWIADLKTGSTLDYSWVAIAVQLALYARAETFYLAATKTHEPMADVDLDVALVFHLPVGAARCDVYFVDIAAGWEMAQVACRVREWRRRKDLAEPWRDDTPVTQPDARRARLRERARAIAAVPGGRERLVAAWPAGVPGLKGDHPHSADELDLVALALSVVEADLRLPFPDPDPATTVPRPAPASDPFAVFDHYRTQEREP